jgi:two-component system OmpR family response regulator
MRILVIEDNPKMAAAIQRGLVERGYAVDVCTSGFEGEEAAGSTPYDAIVLDLMLPDRDGLDVCRNLRRRKIGAPVLMLTALGSTADKVTGLDAGADDYLTKPFEFEELLARVRALVRRGSAIEAGVLAFGDLELDLRTRRARRAGEAIRLSAKEFALLELFLRNPGRVLSRSTIAEKVWDAMYEPASNVIEVHVASLRRKVDRGHERPLIRTVVGMGYRLGDVEDEFGGLAREGR